MYDAIHPPRGASPPIGRSPAVHSIPSPHLPFICVINNSLCGFAQKEPPGLPTAGTRARTAFKIGLS
jgi:hypothetical protein